MIKVGWTKNLWALGVGALAIGAMVANGQQEPLRVAPEQVSGKDVGIGRLVRGVSGKTISGDAFDLATFNGAKGYVIALTDTGCPLCKKYAPTLAALEDEFKDSGVQFVYVNSSAADEQEGIEIAIRTHGFDGPYIWDPSGRVAAQLGASTTTEVFLLDSKKTLVYRGAVDDQYGLGYQNPEPRNTYLSDAIGSLLNGSAPAVDATTAPGCELMLDAKPMSRAVTYHDQVSRILLDNCVSCHRDGGVAPFALDTYKDAKNFRGMMKYVVTNETMPPWFAAPMDHNPWANDSSLSDKEKADLLAWISAGTPEGDPADAPNARTYHNTWQIGEPDAIFEIPKEVDVQATGQMDYMYFVVNTDFEEDRWIDGLEILPTDRAVVHHVLVFQVTDDQLSGKEPNNINGSTGFFMGYVPGTNYVTFPEGFAKKLPAGINLLFQVHYTPNGIATKDQTRIAMSFTEKAPDNVLQVQGVANTRFRIPPGEANHSDTKTIKIPKDIYITNYLAHMHLRGKAFKFDVTYPDGREEVLLDIPRYDFNWQLTYKYTEPKLIPAGSSITVTGTFDNSAGNPANPNPTETVRWGDQTTEEMLLGYFEYYIPGGKADETIGK